MCIITVEVPTAKLYNNMYHFRHKHSTNILQSNQNSTSDPFCVKCVSLESRISQKLQLVDIIRKFYHIIDICILFMNEYGTVSTIIVKY